MRRLEIDGAKSGRGLLWPVAVVVALIVFPRSVLQAQDARKVAHAAFPSVVLLLVQDGQGQPLGLGSGFFVRPDIIATNLHVIEGAANGWARIIGENNKYEIKGTVGVDETRDLALLKLGGVRAAPLELGKSSDVSVGDAVFVVGNPRGLEGTLSEGIVSAIRHVESDTLLQITAPISPGSSGGPVLDRSARVVGVAAATLKGGQNLNFAIPSAYLSSLLEHTNALTPLGSSSSGSGRSAVARLGAKPTEGVVGDQFEWYDSSSFTFSIRNKLSDPVTNVYCLVIFYDYDTGTKPVDTYEGRYSVTVPPGLAKRVGGMVDPSVFNLSGRWDPATESRSTRVEFRVLDFDIVGSPE
jgi:S1-C subfamily serine protease